MSAISLHLQRRFEQRWAAKYFVSPGRAGSTKKRWIESHAVKNSAPAAKAKEKPPGVNRLRSSLGQ
jgi:hypothetical protein